MKKNLKFIDYPDFTPNINPKEMFNIGIMGGSYFRNIKSPKTNKTYSNHHKKFAFLKNIPDNKICNDEYDKNINKYKVKVGSTYEYWIAQKWIKEDLDPYGWIQWYCNFWLGRRSYDDERQIDRWKGVAGKNGRFRKQLQNKINEYGSNDERISPRIRQTLLHWGFDSSKMKVQKNK